MMSDRLEIAIEEAERFTERAKSLKSRLGRIPPNYVTGPEAAATKRASMDLTKALAKLRGRRP